MLARATKLAVGCLALATIGSAAGQDRESHARSLAATCANCHGTTGLSAGGTADLSGMSQDVLVRAMQEYRSGKRPATVMQQLAKGYTDDEIAAIGEWYAKQPRR